MRQYSAEVTINASAETIWQILTDPSGYPEWDPGMERVEGSFKAGEKMKLFTKMSPERAFPVTVTSVNTGESIVLTGGMPLGLFKSERTHTLTPAGDGAVKFTTREIFSGLMLPLIGRSIPDLTTAFEQFAAGLKAKAEGS